MGDDHVTHYVLPQINEWRNNEEERSSSTRQPPCSWPCRMLTVIDRCISFCSLMIHANNACCCTASWTADDNTAFISMPPLRTGTSSVASPLELKRIRTFSAYILRQHQRCHNSPITVSKMPDTNRIQQQDLYVTVILSKLKYLKFKNI